jgi:hypothetical protein
VGVEAASSRGGPGEEICHLNYAGCPPVKSGRPDDRWASLGVGNRGVDGPVGILEAPGKNLGRLVVPQKVDCVGRGELVPGPGVAIMEMAITEYRVWLDSRFGVETAKSGSLPLTTVR